MFVSVILEIYLSYHKYAANFVTGIDEKSYRKPHKPYY